MRRRVFAATVATAALALLPACTGAPVLEVEDGRFSSPEVGSAARATQVRRAAAGLGWTVEDLGPGRLRATLDDTAGRRATVAITLSPTTFSIRHAASAGYDHAGRRIAPDYNREVARLRDAIVAQSAF